MKKGFTLIELLVSVSVFSIIMAVASGVFIQAIKIQRRILAQQELLDQTSYLMEYMSRAARMAKKDTAGNCLTTAGPGNNYEGNSDRNRIRFLNYQNICQEFSLAGGQLVEQKSSDNTAANFQAPAALTSNGLQVLYFDVYHRGSSQLDASQPSVTLFLEIKGRESSQIKIQTMISQRNLDVKK